MYPLLQKALFTQDPEWAHDFTIKWLKRTQRTPLTCFYREKIARKPVELFGLTFDNPVGLAAGLDKNGECIDGFAQMGFGFIEVGTVTPKPQEGNPLPRLFRVKEANSIINRMGFNNKGVDYLVEQVKNTDYKGVIGINIGKNKVTPEENALDDYLICLKKVYNHAGYIVVNISSPNTPGLRNLQYGEALDNLLAGLKQEQANLAQQHGKYVPLLVKIAPDLNDEEILSIAASLANAAVDGVIATNTTLERSMIQGLPHADEAGGLSGSALTQMSQSVTEKLVKALDGAMPVVGVGGIDSGDAAKARMDAGAQLLQVYSSFIYRGPALIKEIVESL